MKSHQEERIRILKRMRELGMKPVAPAFAGFVPQGHKRVHPEAETFTLLWLPEKVKNFDAHYGFSPNTVVSIQTKSGTNEFHGGLFEFIRNGE